MGANNKKLTTLQWIAKVIKKHGNKYGYENAVYVGARNKITITCSVHGDFEQEAYAHSIGKGCKKCATLRNKKTRTLTLKEWIAKCIIKHGDKYDYSKVNYVNCKIKVIIICPIHGEFHQIPSAHSHGKGCKKCATNDNKNRFIHTKKDFIVASKKFHGDKYDYSKADYRGSNVKLTIICPEHGEFQQFATNHVKGIGCAKCSGNSKLNTEQWILEAIAFHGDKYDYSKAVYGNSFSVLIIICPEHGEFSQAANVHKNGSGCPACAKYGFNSIAPARLYYLRVENRNQLCYKIGITNNELTGRYFGSDWDKITVLLDTLYSSGSEAKEEEDRIKEEFKAFKYTGEKLLLGVGTAELFTKDVLLLDHHN